VECVTVDASRTRGAKEAGRYELPAFVVSGDRRRNLHGLRDRANFLVELRSRFTRIGVATDTPVTRTAGDALL